MIGAGTGEDATYSPVILEVIRANALPWIRAQRAAHRPHGNPVPPLARETLSSHVSSTVLDSVRVVEVDQVGNPPFHDQLDAVGVEMPLDFRNSNGVTFDDTILIRRANRSAQRFECLLFHEIVHVAQYARLRIE